METKIALNRAHRQKALNTLTISERKKYLREETFSRAFCATMGHPVARLWRKFADKKIADLNARFDLRRAKFKSQKKAMPSIETEVYEGLLARYSNGLDASATGWKSFKKNASNPKPLVIRNRLYRGTTLIEEMATKVPR